GFVDLAIHPLVQEILSRYLGANYELTEAKGWKSLPTKKDFHGWHGDMWYDQNVETQIHREIKLAMYLTDVRSGAFNVIKGTHQQQHPHNLKRAEIKDLPMDRRIELKGPAGTAFLFDTTVIHRQGVPMLEPRQAIFYAYHDPRVRIQDEDVYYNRYHPLLLNAAFLGGLSPEDQRVLGFGNKTNFQPAFTRHEDPPFIYRAYCASLGISLRWEQFCERMTARWRRILGKQPANRYSPIPKCTLTQTAQTKARRRSCRSSALRRSVSAARRCLRASCQSNCMSAAGKVFFAFFPNPRMRFAISWICRTYSL